MEWILDQWLAVLTFYLGVLFGLVLPILLGVMD